MWMQLLKCAVSVFLLKLLREQWMQLGQLRTVFQAIILGRLTYAIQVWALILMWSSNRGLMHF